ncbi:MAG: GFA family protein [Gammaproteobacteria bacterium]|nr:GFA family protein [Gammaproteobacteria bacterium]MBT4492809.1 GFA family protein [Gammaproteobacteria bacterium]
MTAPTKWCGHCHCTICQRIHGSGAVTWVGCEELSVEIVDPDSQLRWYESTSGAQRGSCLQCGTHLFFKSINWPGELHITRTSFTGDIDREPGGHSFYDTHVTWMSLTDSPD